MMVWEIRYGMEGKFFNKDATIEVGNLERFIRDNNVNQILSIYLKKVYTKAEVEK